MVTLSSSQFGDPYFTQGGQGKFFHDPKPIDAARYHKGYTPERMRGVSEAAIEVHPGAVIVAGHEDDEPRYARPSSLGIRTVK